ncbi:MAG: carboxynorspermidine decarboxylase [Methylomonas sp.]|nr:carboxynorspermidine decarboxylase [Methylomonas sp.]PPD23993.1 MAG: carboxynorspermidine decarboxylase [Methylomonas sp.]PPD32214.1 MAG: carboxynorspermidine decarboxylase [Methylomonas sp.]PPD53283.1 MAG: carboxynorspermidine decarboxylase [Methylomonas sp.]
MHFEQIKQHIVSTPAFAIDRPRILANTQPLAALRQASGCRVLYSIKALPLIDVLTWLKPVVDGFSVSSWFEARLASEVASGQASIHLTTPGLRDHEFADISQRCSHISFNSLPQFQRLHGRGHGFSPGLRINPKLSFADDARYDPCRLHSKLGIAIDTLTGRLPEGVEGLHFHTVFARSDFAPLQHTLAALTPLLARNPQLKWLNVGGGYLYHAIADQQALIDSIADIKRRHALEIYLEPGNAVVNDAACLLTSVIDRFVSDGQTVLVLDTSINHHPEVFEYQRKPPLLEENPQGRHEALLAGSTCLAGDLFGNYRFDTLPAVGDRLTFTNVGAYTLVKAHRFNGYDLPTLYSIDGDQITLLKQYGYRAYRVQWALDDNHSGGV